MEYSINNPWIAEREATLCVWKVDQNRGFISNMNPSLFSDFMSYSNRQISDYVKMIKACGFTGIQVTDICSAWRASLSWETVHDRFKYLADELHKNGMHFTVWVWAAEFTSHGWNDEKVSYLSRDPGITAFDDPNVRGRIEEYYDIYAELAPYSDRVIAHFFDPGNFEDTETIICFAKLLFSKFKILNPDVKCGIDTWGSPSDFPEKLVAAGLKDVMLMENPLLSNWSGEKRAKFREGVKKLGCELGAWDWYTADYEIDQMPIFTVNNRVIKNVYNRTREQGDHVLTPSYWSEIDSYHVLNFFSLYAAGHLLTDPNADPDALLRESARIVDSEHENELYSVLEFVMKSRSGNTWEEYWWTYRDSYVMFNGDDVSLLDGAGEAIKTLEQLIESAGNRKPGVPMPTSLSQLYRLMLPHLYQIKQYREFRVKFAKLKEMQKNGVAKSTLQMVVNYLPFEIPEYNTVTGLWGQVEGRLAYKQVCEFCDEFGLESPHRPVYEFTVKRRLYEHLAVLQRGKCEPVYVPKYFYESALPFGIKLNDRLINEMIHDKILIEREDGWIALVQWRCYMFDFAV